MRLGLDAGILAKGAMRHFWDNREPGDVVYAGAGKKIL